MHDYRSYYKKPEEVALSNQFHREMLSRGILIAPTATCFFSTAVTAAEESLFLSAFEDSLAALG